MIVWGGIFVLCIPSCSQRDTSKSSVAGESASVDEKALGAQQSTDDGGADSGVSNKSAPIPRKIVIVLLDALRPDYLGFVDNKSRETAPYLASLSDQAMVFTRAFSTSTWTAPSTASLFTSLYPQQHGIQYGFRAQQSNIDKYRDDEDVDIEMDVLPEDRKLLAELLTEMGYKTFGLATNINISEPLGFNRGFRKFMYIPYHRGPAEVVAAQLKEWAPEIKSAERSFVYLHLNDPHQPYEFRKAFYACIEDCKDPREDTRARYRSEIGYVDAQLKRMFRMLGVDDDTLLVVLSDHGEEFWDHGGTEHGPTLYWELNRVLLMYRWPAGGIVPGKKNVNVSHVDLLPTLLEFVGAKRPRGLEGTSLVPVLRNADRGKTQHRLRQRALFAHRLYSKINDKHLTALIVGSWKLIDYFHERSELYHHDGDLYEQRDISRTRPRTVNRLERRLQKANRRLNQHKTVNKQVKVKLDQTLLKKLRSLGYVEEGNAAQK
ncbi:MAG: sulfatase [Deltaproteobacteria bacterium]|nr:sulfatase [Deltaproteobacteria bacterium]MBN2674642.1 sulfatase [Deltaproteobacteria bacterium]